ncbi:MAG: protein kinase, partial [Ktedonobacteraceae bacterium]
MASSSLFCDHCGAANRGSASFCFVCGQALKRPSDRNASGSLAADHMLQQRYRILSQVGRGGFGSVYRAADTQLGGRLVAIKEMSQGGLNPHEVTEATNAFKNEAILLASLKHHNLPSIHEYFSEDGRWYLVMDFIEGQTLEDYLRGIADQRLPFGEVLDSGIQLCNVLDYLHTRQPPVIFRDLKPANVMRTPDGQLYLIDFGIARHFKPGQARDTTAFGSAGYAAPEQYGKAQTTPRADIYSLGATLYQSLTGHDPADTPFQFEPPRTYVETVHPTFDALIMRMLAMDVSKRPVSMAEIKRELQQIATEWSTGRIPRVPGSRIKRPVQATAVPLPAPKPAFSLPFSYKGHNDAVRALAWSPNSLSIASAGRDQAVRVWNVRSGETHLVYREHVAPVRAIAWSPAGPPTSAPREACIASGSEDRTVHIWNASNGQHMLTYKGHTHYVNSLAWSPDGRLVASASIDRTVQVWDPATGKCLLTYGGHTEMVYAVAWSPDGQYIASGSTDKTVQVWQAHTGQRVRTYRGHLGYVRTLAWSPDSTHIVSAGEERLAHVWYTATGELLLSHAQESYVLALAWSPDGQHIASGCEEGGVDVW